RARDLGGEVQVHGAGDAGAELAEGVSGVLVDAIGGDEAFAVLLQPLGGGLLVAALDVGLGVVALHGHVAGDEEHRGARGVGRGQGADHQREARAFGAGGGGDLAGDAGEGVRGGGHVPLVASAVAGNPLVGDGGDHRV